MFGIRISVFNSQVLNNVLSFVNVIFNRHGNWEKGPIGPFGCFVLTKDIV